LPVVYFITSVYYSIQLFYINTDIVSSEKLWFLIKKSIEPLLSIIIHRSSRQCTRVISYKSRPEIQLKWSFSQTLYRHSNSDNNSNDDEFLRLTLTIIIIISTLDSVWPDYKLYQRSFVALYLHKQSQVLDWSVGGVGVGGWRQCSSLNPAKFSRETESEIISRDKGKLCYLVLPVKGKWWWWGASRPL